MIKKAFIALAVIAVLIGAVVIWFWRSMGFTEAARLVPGDAIALVELPDLPRTAFRWPQTAIAKVTGEPEVRAFLEKPLGVFFGPAEPKSDKGAKGPKKSDGNSPAEVLLRLKPGHIFASVLSVSSSDSSLLVGFQFWGGKGDCDHAVARIRKEIERSQKAIEQKTEAYHGDEITSTNYGNFTLYTACHGHWGFLANHPEGIKQALDRAAGRTVGGSLAENTKFQAATKRLLADPDFLFFSQPERFIDTLLAVGATAGAKVNPEQIEQIRKVQAIGASIKLDGLDLRDSIFILHDNPPKLGQLAHAGIQLTDEKTAGYVDFLLNFQQLGLLGQANGFLNLPSLQSTQLPSLLPEAYGPECAIVMNWAEGQMKPDGFIAAQIRDKAKAAATIEEMTAVFPQFTVTDIGGFKAYNFINLNGVMSSPTFALVDGFLVIGLNPSDVERAVAAQKAGKPLLKAPAFAYARSEFQSANEVFGYLDIRAAFTRFYPLAKQIAIFSAAINPSSTSAIDVNKLPSTEAVAKHLNPIVYAQSRYDDGYLLQSRGPISLSQAGFLGAYGAAPLLKNLR